MTDKHTKIVITGAAGLVGQNLVVELKRQGYTRLVAIDKHAHNLQILAGLHPEVRTVLADLAEPGAWQDEFEVAGCVAQLHAQITGKHTAIFTRNNIEATRRVLDAVKRHRVPWLVHISSSVVKPLASQNLSSTNIPITGFASPCSIPPPAPSISPTASRSSSLKLSASKSFTAR